ncbi:hypothetical protein HGH93_15140 [Chitinophaga polysaccharea]|uniref:hypothetical protein n=1 Tax=Chitinophaga TaxID=79328 RepID=UPI001455331F|nr:MULTISPECIES: hypothetical protein [Chitinophaga]NLR59450.1 hypothetical protein [Chitinophaga polysaccharea]NLU96084.1 hypothetical protein [Chitinophaga sp. Ak27]
MKRLCAWLLIGCVHCKPVNVYICDSKYATRYHYNVNCRGLSNCKHQIISIPLEKAMATRTLCKWEQ